MGQYGKASNELFTQFVARVALEMPTATLAMFSTLKYVNAPTLAKFRDAWSAEYIGGFVVHNQAFDGLSGKFPIGFLVWKTNQKIRQKINFVNVEVFGKDANPIGEKIFFNLPSDKYLSEWFVRPRTNKTDVVALKNGITPATATKDLRGRKWADGAIGYMLSGGNDLQHAEQQTVIFSSGYSSARGFYITPENL